MTLDEKLGQLTQAPAGPALGPDYEQQVRDGKLGSFLGVWGADNVRRAQRVAVEQSRLHIPLIFGFDVIHGMRTIYPVPLAMAATFDSAAYVRAARMAATDSHLRLFRILSIGLIPRLL